MIHMYFLIKLIPSAVSPYRTVALHPAVFQCEHLKANSFTGHVLVSRKKAETEKYL